MTDMNNNKPRGNGGENRDRKPSFGGNGERKFGNKPGFGGNRGASGDRKTGFRGESPRIVGIRQL